MSVEALGWSLLHFLWQGAAAAVLLVAVNAFVRRSPQARYLAALATLAAMMALPIATFAVLALRPAGGTVGGSDREPGAAPSFVAAAAPVQNLRQIEVAARVAPALPWLVGGWCLGVALLSIHSLGGWLVAQRLRRSGLHAVAEDLERAAERLCGALRVSRPVKLCVSALVEVPTVIGWLRPVILLPAGALVGLSASQLELVLAHELAHVRRSDYLVNLLQTAVETLLFYHPAVWWVSHRVRVEREHCCDDLAVAACGSALRYARALAQLEGVRASAPRLALAATGGRLAERVGRLVGRPAGSARAPRWAAGIAGLLSLGLTAAMGTLQPLARTAAAERAGDDRTAPPAKRRAKAVARTAPQPARAPEAGRPAERVLPVRAVLELAEAGVDPEYVDEMDALGYRSLSWEQLVALRRHGVGPDYVRGLAAEGVKGLGAEQLLALRSHGVGPDYIRGLKAAGLGDLGLGDLLELRNHGVNPEFAAAMKNIDGEGEPSVSRLVSLRSQGITPDWVRELQELGYEGLSAGRLMALRSQGVNPEEIREFASLGYRGLSVPVLIALRSQGVTPEFVRGMQQAGYRDLAPGALIELRSHGVTPEYARDVQEAGFTRVSPEELIELRSRGVQPHLLKRLKARWQRQEGQR
ncbi:MAG TPA: M56 family metallopeptidase [Vicinamibacteria bacterium]|nr:M56 family metallopeptidase [Vicinamibacteria bacterium]